MSERLNEGGSAMDASKSVQGEPQGGTQKPSAADLLIEAGKIQDKDPERARQLIQQARQRLEGTPIAPGLPESDEGIQPGLSDPKTRRDELARAEKRLGPHGRHID